MMSPRFAQVPEWMWAGCVTSAPPGPAERLTSTQVWVPPTSVSVAMPVCPELLWACFLHGDPAAGADSGGHGRNFRQGGTGRAVDESCGVGVSVLVHLPSTRAAAEKATRNENWPLAG